MELAATWKIPFKGNVWVVPSQSGSGVYNVELSPEPGTCTCADFRAGAIKCKHIYAASYAQMRTKNTGRDAAVSEELKAIAVKRKTYPQVWPAYTRAQINEKDQFQVFLCALCAGVGELPRKTKGRPSMPLKDALFCCTFKVWRVTSSLEDHVRFRERRRLDSSVARSTH